MELSFLYIKKFGRVQEVGLNFNSNFRYEYNPVNEELNIVKINDFSERFYKKYNAEITSLSAIVGQNGVGKTTILNFIKNNLTDGTGGVYSPCLIGMYNKVTDKHEIYFYEIDEPKLKFNSIQVELRKMSKDKIAFNEVEVSNSINAFQDLTFINYSGLLDLTQIEGEYGSSFNITTNYLAHTASKKHTGEDRRFNFNEIEVFRTQEVERQLRFYSKFKDLLPFKKPEFIEIKINPFNQLQFDKDLYEKWLHYSSEIDKLKNIITKTKEENEELIKYELWRDSLIKFNTLILELVKNINKNGFRNFEVDIYLQLFYCFIKEQINFISFLPNTIAILERVVNEIQTEPKTSSEVLKILFDFGNVEDLTTDQQMTYIDFRNILPQIEKILSISEYKGIFEQQDYLLLNDQNENVLFEFLKFQTNSTNSNFIEFFWPLSSGQQTLFSMFSRFYDIIHRAKPFGNDKIKDNILILLDEAEISLHPEWQRSFLDNFLKMITTLFENKKIQIIITTHSPFLLSDLVNSQVNFLELDEETNRGKVVINPISEKESTFGANISTLLQDAFFMKNGFLGGIVLQQMDDFIDFILNREISELKKEYDYIDWFINQIGEPIIKNKIIRLLENRLSVDLLNTQERMDEIEKRLKK